MAFMSGEQTHEAMVAALRFDMFVETVIAVGKKLGSKVR